MSREQLVQIESALRSVMRSAPVGNREELRVALATVRHVAQRMTVLEEVAQRVEKVERELKAACEPPLQYGIFLSAKRPLQESESASVPADDSEEIETTLAQRVVVGLNGQRYETVFEVQEVDAHTISEGHSVLLNKLLHVVEVGDAYTGGEVAEVINRLLPDGAAEVLSVAPSGSVLVRQSGAQDFQVACAPSVSLDLQVGDSVALDENRLRALGKVKPRLHVRVGGASDGIVVDVSDALYQRGVEIGDIVRVDSNLRFAFERLPAYETGSLILEEIPDVAYQDIAGLEQEISEIRDAIELPYLHRNLFANLRLDRPKGILLYGPPGCGKTMIAKAVANSLTHSIRTYAQLVLDKLEQYSTLHGQPDSASTLNALEEELRAIDIDPSNAEAEAQRIRVILDREGGVRSYFLNVKGPELLDKYVGETEHRIRKLFSDAKRRASFFTPVVVFFDEMESMFRARGSGRSSDIETTIVPQFLAEMDGVESSENVILIGASNRPELIDPAIQRPGRLDIKIRIQRPDRKAALAIVALKLTPDLPLSEETPANTRGIQSVTFAPSIVDRVLTTLTRTLTTEQRLQLSELVTDGDLRQAWATSAALRATCRDPALRAVIESGIQREWRAEALITRIVDLLYDPVSRLEVVTTKGKRHMFPMRVFVAGAVLHAIVARVKKSALKRMVEGDSDGICNADVRAAVFAELDASKEQLALQQLREQGQQTIDVIGTQLVQLVEIHLAGERDDMFRYQKAKIYAESRGQV